MICMLCEKSIEENEHFVPSMLRVRAERPDDEMIVLRPLVTDAGIHVRCLLGLLGLQVVEEGAEAPEEDEAELPLDALPEIGFCSAPGCTERAYKTASGPRCAAGHVVDSPLASAYREGDD